MYQILHSVGGYPIIALTSVQVPETYTAFKRSPSPLVLLYNSAVTALFSPLL